jgi:glucan phosphoethanolaminetransferase (alkaline phosphatase superfamily)
MKQTTLLIVALTLSAASVGCAWTVNIALYRLWSLVPIGAFPAYQAAHEIHFVPLAALLGIPNLIVAILLARQGLPTVPRWLLWVGASLALVPWVATPAYFIPLQSQLALAGPTPELVAQLVTADMALRALPVTLQLGTVLWALRSTSYREASEQQRLAMTLRR